MTNFDKALEAAANDEANEGWKWARSKLKQKDPSISYEYGVKAGFKIGSSWSRDFTIAEVLRWMKEDYFKYPDNQVTQAFEQHFIKQKEQK